MSTTSAALIAAAAVLLFWAVGAYNRLVALRNEIARAFAGVEAHLRQRQPLLLGWAAAVRQGLPSAGPLVDAVVGACDQLLAASDAARLRPTRAAVAASLRLAEDTLSAARARLQAELLAHPEVVDSLGLAPLAEEIAAADSTLGFARRQFNEATQRYNDAARQFPTLLLAGVFGFRAAGTL